MYIPGTDGAMAPKRDREENFKVLKVRQAFIFLLRFIRDLMGYLSLRVSQFVRIVSAIYEVLAVVSSRWKNVLVSKLFWGRGDLYKVFFRGTLIFALVGWLYSSYGRVASYADPSMADSTFVVQQKAFDIELGSSAPPTDKDRPRDSIQEYVVQGGDTISSISVKFDISVDTIKWSNGLTSDYIKPGQTLKILPVTGVLHKVKSGDSLASVAKKYGASEQAIADVNWLDPPFNLQTDQELMIPGGSIATPVAPTVPSVQSVPYTYPTAGTGQFIRPTTGYYSQYYSRWHRAVDIANRAAPDVVAADSGKVIYSGWDSSGYGLTILIDHGNGFVTRYAHSSSLYVRSGQYVTRGQPIMKMGSTGRSTGTHLHFEVILNGVKQNPLAYF